MEIKDRFCCECQKQILDGEMTHVQTNPPKTYHWECYRKWVDRMVRWGIQYYENRRLQLQTVR
jgi:hypothetical protein